MIEAIDREATAASNVRPTGGPSGQRKAGGAMRSREVQLLGRRRRERKLCWLRHGRYWLLSIGRGGLLALAPVGERWSVVRLDREQVERLAVDVDLAYAHGIAEDYVRQAGAMTLADSSARWRQAPMNDAQARLLRHLRITPPESATKGEASDLITVARGAALLDRLARRAA